MSERSSLLSLFPQRARVPLHFPVSSALRKVLAQGYGSTEFRADVLAGLYTDVLIPEAVAMELRQPATLWLLKTSSGDWQAAVERGSTRVVTSHYEDGRVPAHSKAHWDSKSRWPEQFGLICRRKQAAAGNG